jgi:hypothetical protein
MKLLKEVIECPLSLGFALVFVIAATLLILPSVGVISYGTGAMLGTVNYFALIFLLLLGSIQ